MKFCPYCGYQLSEGSLFCASCGCKIEDMSEYVELSKTSAAPVNESSKEEMPTFTAPPEDIPTFTPPPQDIPTFTPPPQDIPTFTPPPQTRPSGPVCHYHRDESAVATCACCGKYICQDCAEAYGVVSGQYAGRALCYDCTAKMVEDNLVTLKKNKNKIMLTYIFTLVGMVLGIMVGVSYGGWGIFFGAAIGGCFWTFVKCFFRRMGNALGAASTDGTGFIVGIVFAAIVAFMIEAIVSVYRTGSKLVTYTIYLVKTSGFIKQDSAGLAQMKDYMEYTMVISQNKGVDLETLMNDGSQLYNNAYAQSIRTNGEQRADEMLRQCVTTIAENGEIIRSFAA